MKMGYSRHRHHARDTSVEPRLLTLWCSDYRYLHDLRHANLDLSIPALISVPISIDNNGTGPIIIFTRSRPSKETDVAGPDVQDCMMRKVDKILMDKDSKILRF